MSEPTYYRWRCTLYRLSGEYVEYQRVDGIWRLSQAYDSASFAELIADGRATPSTPTGRMTRRAIKAVTERAVTCGK